MCVSKIYFYLSVMDVYLHTSVYNVHAVPSKVRREMSDSPNPLELGLLMAVSQQVTAEPGFSGRKATVLNH